ncbi:MAG: hypothetical protein ACYC2E_04620 [Sulfuricella sp.]
MLKVITNIVGFLTIASTVACIIMVPAVALGIGVIVGIAYLLNPPT